MSVAGSLVIGAAVCGTGAVCAWGACEVPSLGIKLDAAMMQTPIKPAPAKSFWPLVSGFFDSFFLFVFGDSSIMAMSSGSTVAFLLFCFGAPADVGSSAWSTS